MKIGFIGLGRMGYNMVERLIEKGHDCVVTNDRNEEARTRAEKAGATAVTELEDLVKGLVAPRLIWIMVPRSAVQSVLDDLTPLLEKGDTIIDGGNTYFKDTIRRAQELKEKEINYIDAGVSGGVEGARHGACIMVGGERALFDTHEQLFKDLTVEDGYGYMGSSGAGHFVKMVHNGIEYGMMSAIAEGIAAIDQYKSDFDTDLEEVIKVYDHGSIIESRLMEWLAKAWKEDKNLTKLPGVIPVGETEEEMEKLVELATMPTLISARNARVATREGETPFFGKVINALRFQFGGHSPTKK